MTEEKANNFDALFETVKQLASAHMLDSEITVMLALFVRPVCCQSENMCRLFEKHGWDPDKNCFNSPVDIKRLMADLQKVKNDKLLAKFVYGESTNEWLNYI